MEKLGLARGGCGDCGQPAFRPIRDRGENWFKCAATLGQSIAHPYRRTWIHEAFDEALSLELAQPLGEDAITDAGDTSKELIETRRGREQRFYDRPSPTLPYQLDSTLKGRAVVEAPTDHGERFYALSVVSETTGDFYFFDFLGATLEGFAESMENPRR